MRKTTPEVKRAWRPTSRATFDRLGDEPGSFRARHFHPSFEGNEPCERVWDSRLTADPWGWSGDRVRAFGAGSASQPARLDPDDAAEIRAMAEQVVSIGQRFSPERCASVTGSCATCAGQSS